MSVLIEITPMKVVTIITYKVNDANNTSENDNDEDNYDKNAISINIRKRNELELPWHIINVKK